RFGNNSYSYPSYSIYEKRYRTLVSSSNNVYIKYDSESKSSQFVINWEKRTDCYYELEENLGSFSYPRYGYYGYYGYYRNDDQYCMIRITAASQTLIEIEFSKFNILIGDNLIIR
ncbi:unnamed protein product, partial [Meganyctiphanes norvegica]